MLVDFDTVLNRQTTNSYKWDIDENELPMWVADMDFETAPVVVEAIQKRVAQNVFGYSIVPKSFSESIVRWWQKRHHWKIENEWVLFCTGAVPAISSIVRKLTKQHENVVVLTPVYNIFFNSILNNDRNVLASELNYTNGDYTIDFDDLEAKLADPLTKLLIFCNPHNPIGKVWDKETLRRIGQLCIKYDVRIISDELHCDLTHPGYVYTPFASISTEIGAQVISLVSASKTFNLAGLQSSAIIVSNEAVREKVNRAINTDEVAEPNVFAIQATEAAFNHGEQWLEELNLYLYRNKTHLEESLTKLVPELKLIPSEATYLAWLDCSEITEDTADLNEFIRKKTGLILSAGKIFGGNGDTFIRLNYACPKDTLTNGIQRLVHGVNLYKEEHR